MSNSYIFVAKISCLADDDDDTLVTCGSAIKLKSSQRGSEALYHLYSDGKQTMIFTFLFNSYFKILHCD